MVAWRSRKISSQSSSKDDSARRSNWLGLGSVLVVVLLVGGCGGFSGGGSSLTAAKRGFKTVVKPRKQVPDAVVAAPEHLFRTVKYSAPSGDLAAYVTPDPGDRQRHPAIIWITGGDCNSIDDVWSPAPRGNDQTAMAFRKAGIVMMFASLRGGNDNPGVKEGFLGEVDDVIAAAKYLEKQPYVDPQRIYLGGHSTGGTLAMLVAESTDRFRGVFSFGPVADVEGYGTDYMPSFDTSNPKEIRLRSPGYWLGAVRKPLWVLEGTSRGNIDSLRAMKKISTNPRIHFIGAEGTDHFAILAPTNELLANKILQDRAGSATNINISEKEVNQLFKN
jgi:acetyl esterase/lipase